MKKLLPLLLLLPSLALAQGLTRPVGAHETIVIPTRIGAVVGGATVYTGFILGSKGVTITGATGYTTANASGAGSSGFRVSDGTNNCDCLGNCATASSAGFGSNGAKRLTCTGTCTFAAGSTLTFASNSSCGTTQPNWAYAYAVGIYAP